MLWGIAKVIASLMCEVVIMENLERFVKAQEDSYKQALQEVRDGCKKGHWMWYIFPQVKGLGFSGISEFYGISGKEEAEAYIKHPVLGQRLMEITEALLKLPSNDAYEVFGYPDHLKLKSSMTLFYQVSGEKLFKDVLDKFFAGKEDERTIRYLEKR